MSLIHAAALIRAATRDRSVTLIHAATLIRAAILVATFNAISVCPAFAEDEKSKTRVFIFAGQSNMVGSDSKVQDIARFPPFRGLESPQADVQFSYCIGRENKKKSNGWVSLQPVNQIVGPELSFARDVAQNSDAPIAIIKVAAGGTHLGGDWNPDEPSGFKMYPLALDWVRDALADLTAQGIQYELEGFMWHQGENDMFNEEYKKDYGNNLRRFIECWRRDLDCPDLRFYIGELCTKTIWGMDLRPRMYQISLGQKSVSDKDPLSEYVPTSHVGVEIGGGVGLHYHYGTLGQLEHGVNYADAYLRNVGIDRSESRPLDWPFESGTKVKLFVLAGHRNMEGERAFVQDLETSEDNAQLLRDNREIPYRYNLGGGYKISDGWEPLGPAGYYDTFGPELSFASTLASKVEGNIAIAKFTHSGSQMIDWTPEGSEAESRNLYPAFVAFVQESVHDLRRKGHEVELAGIFYHIGENDMSWGRARRNAPQRLVQLVNQSREDLNRPDLRWFVSQQPPTDDKNVAEIDVTGHIEQAVKSDSNLVHIKVFDPPPQDKQLVLDTEGIVWLGRQLAEAFLSTD